MKLKTLAFALLAATVLWTPAALVPAHGADKDTITGAFDVGPGGFPGNFNPLAATAGFTWLSLYYEPLVIYDDKLRKSVPRSRRDYRGQRRPARPIPSSSRTPSGMTASPSPPPT